MFLKVTLCSCAILISSAFGAAFPEKEDPTNKIETIIQKLQKVQYVPDSEFTAITKSEIRDFMVQTPVTVESTDDKLPCFLYILWKKNMCQIYEDVIEVRSRKRNAKAWDQLVYALNNKKNSNYETYVRRAAEKKLAKAQHLLGEIWYAKTDRNGYRSNAATDEAIRLFTLAAEQGCAEAQSNLGMHYNYNSSTAFMWHQRAAEQGVPYSQYCVARAYRYGSGVERNLQEAERWYTAAIVNGYQQAGVELDAMKKPVCLLL